MRFQIRFANQLVGIFVVVGVVFAATAIVLLGTRQGWFEASHSFYTEVETSANLSVGMPIRYRGFDIGRITGYALDDRGLVTTEFVVFDRYRYLMNEGSLVELSGNPLFGGQMVLHPGPEGSGELAGDSMVPEWTSREGVALREAGITVRSEPQDAISRLIEDINPVLDSIDTVLHSTDRALATINQTLSGEMTDGLMADTMSGVNRLVDEAGDRLAETEQLLARTNTLLTSVQPIIDDTALFTAELRTPEGLIPRLVGTEGSIGALFDDDERVLMQVETILTSLNHSIVELNRIAAFFGDQTPQLAAILEEGRDALAVGQDVLTGLRNNPLLRRGIPDRPAPEAGFESMREAQF